MPTLAQRRRLETRQLILDAAYRVFSAKGYTLATIDDIARGCDVSKGAIYHHFASKEALFKALLDDHSHELDELASVIDRASSFQELISGFVEVWIDHYQSDPLFIPLALEFRVIATREAWARTILAEFYDRIRVLIAALLSAAVASGLARKDLDTNATATLVFGVLDGICVQAAIDPHRVDLAALKTPLVEAIERVIAAKSRGNIRALRRALGTILESSTLRAEEDQRD